MLASITSPHLILSSIPFHSPTFNFDHVTWTRDLALGLSFVHFNSLQFTSSTLGPVLIRLLCVRCLRESIRIPSHLDPPSVQLAAPPPGTSIHHHNHVSPHHPRPPFANSTQDRASACAPKLTTTNSYDFLRITLLLHHTSRKPTLTHFIHSFLLARCPLSDPHTLLFPPGCLVQRRLRYCTSSTQLSEILLYSASSVALTSGPATNIFNLHMISSSAEIKSCSLPCSQLR